MSLMYALFALLAFAAQALTATVPPCKLVANTTGWPSISDWQNLNTSVGGRLAAVSPPGAVCHPGLPNASNASCAAFQVEWTDAFYHADNPFTGIYNDDTCRPDATAPCSSAGYAAYAIEAINATDVQAGVRFAAQTGVRLIVKGTGHDYPGRSKGPGSLEIWTHRLTGLSLSTLNPTTKGLQQIATIKISAGMQWNEVYTFAADHNLTIVAGAERSVGVGGWILGGGHGPVTSLFGLGADQVLELEVVTADGQYQVVNEASNPDLFWALRGGGGSTFAVMLSVTVKVYPGIPGTSIQFSYTTTAASDTFWNMAARFHTHVPGLVDGGTTGYVYVSPSGGSVAGIFIFPQKTRQQAAAIMSPLQRDMSGAGWAAAPIRNSSTPTDFDSFSRFWLSNPQESVGFDGRLGSWLLDAPALNTSLSTLKAQLKKSTPVNNVLITHLVIGRGVREAQIPGGSNAVLPAWRKACIHVGKSKQSRTTVQADISQFWVVSGHPEARRRRQRSRRNFALSVCLR